MKNALQTSEEELFQKASALPRGERDGYLAVACGGDTALRARMEGLLSSPQATRFKREWPPPSGFATEPKLGKPQTGGGMIGPDKLREQIGEGGFGTVWVADQEQPVRRRVALKIIKPGMNTKEVITRFGQERQALAMMDHPNIARVLDAGTTDKGLPFFVMELVRGVKITDYCHDRQLSTMECLDLFITVCRSRYFTRSADPGKNQHHQTI